MTTLSAWFNGLPAFVRMLFTVALVLAAFVVGAAIDGTAGGLLAESCFILGALWAGAYVTL